MWGHPEPKFTPKPQRYSLFSQGELLLDRWNQDKMHLPEISKPWAWEKHSGLAQGKRQYTWRDQGSDRWNSNWIKFTETHKEQQCTQGYYFLNTILVQATCSHHSGGNFLIFQQNFFFFFLSWNRWQDFYLKYLQRGNCYFYPVFACASTPHFIYLHESSCV